MAFNKMRRSRIPKRHRLLQSVVGRRRHTEHLSAAGGRQCSLPAAANMEAKELRPPSRSPQHPRRLREQFLRKRETDLERGGRIDG